MSSCHMLSLISASHGRGLTTLPLTTSKPSGLFIQPLTAITLNEPAKPEITIGMPVEEVRARLSRSQP